MKISTIINYCTNDYRFLALCIHEAKKFSSQVIVPVADHFFNGTLENRDLLLTSYQEHPDTTFIEFEFDEEKPYGFSPTIRKEDPDFIHYWHSTSRYVGYHYVDPQSDFVLFLDVDEIAEGERFKEWLEGYPLAGIDAVRFSSYFYFRKAQSRCDKWIRSALLVRCSKLSPEALLDVYERRGTFYEIRGEKIEDMTGLDGKPLFHHYSWVKTEEEMFKKVSTWGHHLDRDWKSDLAQELKEPFRGKDLFWDLSYQEVRPTHDPLEVKIPEGRAVGPFANRILVDRLGIQKRNLERELFKCGDDLCREDESLSCSRDESRGSDKSRS